VSCFLFYFREPDYGTSADDLEQGGYHDNK